MSIDHSSIVIGFDGFIDTILTPVFKRTSKHSFVPYKTLTAFGEKIASAGKFNANIELVTEHIQMGGNAPLLAHALANLKTPSTLISTCGYPVIDPLFSPLEEKGVYLLPIGQPGHTDAIECKDGKLLLGKMGELSSLTLRQVKQRIGLNVVKESFIHAKFYVFVNWTMMPLVQEMLSFLLSLYKKHPSLTEKKQLFIDLADPAKRPKKELLKCLSTLSELQNYLDVTVSLNRSEAEQALVSLGERPRGLSVNAEILQKRLNLSTILIHHKTGCALQSGPFKAYIPIPVCKKPARTTGAGDVFNAGYLYGIVHEKPLLSAFKDAIAASSIHVRTGLELNQELLNRFIEETPWINLEGDFRQ